MIKETEIKTNERTNKQTDKQLDKKNPTQMTQTQTGIYIQMRIDMHAKKNVQTMSKSEKIYFKCL